MDSVGTFRVDKKVSEKMKELLVLASELGAIQDIDNDGLYLKTDIDNNIFRFSYALYPKFGIPVREDNPINLSRILKDIYQENQMSLDYGNQFS